MKNFESLLTWILVPLCLGLMTNEYMKTKKMKAEAEKYAQEAQIAEAKAEARVLLIADRTIIVEVEHDSDPSTTTYPVTLSATNSFDNDQGDELSFFWTQIGGSSVRLDGTRKTSEAKFDAEAGEYEFILSISDNYGESCSDTVIINVKPEPNSCPTPVITK
jgi:hypothetical protein